MIDSTGEAVQLELILEDLSTRLHTLRAQHEAHYDLTGSYSAQLLELSRSARQVSAELRAHASAIRNSADD